MIVKMAEDKIKHSIPSNISGCGCNLECSYCYLRQADYNQTRKKTVLKYPLETIRKACTLERLGGSCLFTITGDGETLLPEESISLFQTLLEEGHYVTFHTNGTLTVRLHELVEKIGNIDKLPFLHVTFSFHYMELKKKNMLDIFFGNIRYIHEEGISYNIVMMIGEEIDENVAQEVRRLCMKEIGAYPQVCIARKDNSDGTFGICTKLSKEDYYRLGDQFNSSLFDLEKREFNYKRKEFCYAGKWLFWLNFTTGHAWQCLSNDTNPIQFYEKLDEKIDDKLRPVGYCCKRAYCSCTNFQAWGIMPEHEEQTNMESFDRPEAGWLKGPIRKVYAQKLSETNELYSDTEKEELYSWYLSKELVNQKYYLIKAKFNKGDYIGLNQEIRDLLEITRAEMEIFWMPDLISTYGCVLALYETSNATKERQVYESYYESLKENPTYLLYLGYLYMSDSQNIKAIALFEKVANCSNDKEEVRAARECAAIIAKII